MLNLIYALQNNKLVHISQVEKGISSNCVCPYCNTRLIAKKGEINKHHFAHQNARLCEYGYETSLHIAAKDIISKAKKLKLPALFGMRGKIFPSTYIAIDNVKLEKRISDIIPDIIIESKGKQLLVEIFVTHAIDDEKLKKIEKLGISTIEIYLGFIDDKTTILEIEDTLINSTEYKDWIFNSRKKEIDIQFDKYVKELFIKENKVICSMIKHVHGKLRTINYNVNCSKCKFYRGRASEDSIFCSGEKCVSDYNDLKLTLQERLKKYKIYKKKNPIHGLCPECGETLEVRRTYKGFILGCSAYPNCEFHENGNRKILQLRLQNRCPNCGDKLEEILNKNRKEFFLGCINYPKCHYAESIELGKPCPKCGGKLFVKKGSNGVFYGCFNYPQCRYTENIEINKSTGEIIRK